MCQGMRILNLTLNFKLGDFIMKKSIVALAVLAAGLAQADGTTLYGSVRMAYTYDSHDEGAVINGKAKSTSKFGNNGSRFGIKGTDDLGNGLTAFYKYENRIKDNLDTNKLYAGLKGGFGTVSFGKQNGPRDNLSNFSDPTNQFEAGYGRSAVTSWDNSAAYITPDMGGFTAAAAIVANGEAGPNRHVDGYDLLAQYNANGFYAGLGYQAYNPSKDFYPTKAAKDAAKEKNLGLGLGYENDMFNVGLLVEKELNKGKVDPLFVRLGGAYNVTDMDTIYASASYYKCDTAKDACTHKDDDGNVITTAGKNKVKGAALGYEHKFSKQTKVWAEYGYRSKLATGMKSSNKFGLGLRTDF